MDDDDGDVAATVPRFEGEDVSLTTERELKGWYSIGLAAEIYAVCGVGSFAPVMLEQLARERGVLRSAGRPCIEPMDVAQQGSALLSRWLARASEADAEDQCIVRPFGRPVSTASFALYTFSTAVFLQALVLITFSPVADYGTRRKRLLMTFAFTGAISTTLFIIVSSRFYLLGSILTVIGVVCLGSSFVLLNSFLPLLAARHPDVQHKHSVTSPLKLSVRISAKGVGLGYAAAVSVQILSIGLLVLLKKANFVNGSSPLRCVLLLVGLCWATLTIPGALWLKDRPGPPLPPTSFRNVRLPAVLQYLVFAWTAVWQTVKTAAKLRQTGVFLLAWFLLSDAIATVSGTAILFARTELHMGTIPIALLSITATSSGIAGAFFWPRISKHFGFQTKTAIIACMLMMEIIPFYGLLGFIPFIKAWGVGGLQQAWEIYPLGFVHGFVMGGLSSYCRAFYGEIIPPGREAAFYALYAITDKGSSAMGPAIVGAIVDSVGTIRPAFGFLAVLIALPIPLVYYVDVSKGRADAVALSDQGKHASGSSMAMDDYDRGQDSSAAEGLLRQSSDHARDY